MTFYNTSIPPFCLFFLKYTHNTYTIIFFVLMYNITIVLLLYTVYLYKKSLEIWRKLASGSQFQKVSLFNESKDNATD